MLEDMVETKSHGKLKLKLEKFSFNYFNKKMKLENAVFYSDSAGQSSSYKFSIDRIELRAKAILPIILRNEFLIDSIRLVRPDITVTRLKAIVKPDNTKKEDVSIPEEMGKIYRSIQDAMEQLRIKRFDINEGTFTLVNKIDPTQLPLSISKIDFQIDNFQVSQDSSRTNKILFSDNVILRSSNQNILFPDGRHKLSFSRFRINLKRKLVEFDSCTIAATRGDSASSSFNVFFDQLQLSNIDFDTLYKSEVIKADKVFCLNPTFNLEVEVGNRKGVASAPPPKLENIIEQLTGDLLIEHVIVNNAAFNIKTLRQGVPSSFTFTNNNFEMLGLRVEQESPKPISVRSFSLAIRNYENFIKDSLYSVRFDSVVFKDDRIRLSNFLFNKMDNKGRVINTFSIPEFSLSGLSWDDLVFENKLKADQAIMYNPYINFTASNTMKKKGGSNVFQSLGVLNEYMDLQQLDIVNGNIDLKLKNKLRVQLDGATISVKSHALLESRKMASIKNALLLLRFNKGIIHAGNFDLEINDIDYKGGSGAFDAGNIQVIQNKKRTILEKVHVQKLLVDEMSGGLFAEGLVWQKANIRTDAFGGGQGGSSIVLKSVHGFNTIINGPINGKIFSASLDEISFTELIKTPGKKLILDKLALSGRQLLFRDSSTNIAIAAFNIIDGKTSLLNRVRFDSPNTHVSIPSLSLVPDISLLLDGNLQMNAVIASKPRIQIHVTQKNETKKTTTAGFPPITMGSLRLIQPSIDYTVDQDSVSISVQWQGEKNVSSYAEVKNFKVDGNSTSAKTLNFYLTDFIYSDTKGKRFTTGDGKFTASLADILIKQIPNGQPEWQAVVKRLDVSDFRMDSIGVSKRNIELTKGKLENLHISSSLTSNMQKFVAANLRFSLQELTGKYADISNKIEWSNISFNRSNNTLHADSFSIHPVLSKDSFMAKQPYSTDYLDYSFGKISAGPVDLDKYISDNKIHVGKIDIDKFTFLDYRDNTLPKAPGVVKLLPVKMIKLMKQKLRIDTIHMSNAMVDYIERSNITGNAGTLPVRRMEALITGVKNYDLKSSDSLYINAKGYLMDTIWINLTFKESYLDSLSGFRLGVKMKPLDPTVFNSMLIPLNAVKLESGFIDTLDMQAIGHDHFAFGKINLFYHDLKVRFVPPPGKKTSLLLKLKNFAANTLVVKDKNDSRSSIVFYIRDPERSSINYIVKTTLSGIGSSVMGTSDKKLIRRYKKQLETKKLNPVDFNWNDKSQ